MAKQTIKSRAEQLLYDDLCADGYEPVMGHKFHPTMGWKFDLAYPSVQLAIEIDGQDHRRWNEHFVRDRQKLNAALELGWRVLAYPASRVKTHKRRARIVKQIARVLCGVSSPEDAEIVLVGD